MRSSEPVRTTFSRAQGQRLQGLASTLQLRPLMQIVMSSESELNVTSCLQELGVYLDAVAPKAGYPPFAERIRQVHKDHALAIESARQVVLPGARPVDDFPHFDRHAQKEIFARCVRTHVDEKSGRAMKTHAGLLMAFYHEVRTVLTLDLFSELWRGMFARMREEFDECAVVDYLSKTYFVEVIAGDLEKDFAVAPASGAESPYLWSGHWRGALGLIPGTGSGNQATEAFHRPFAEEIEAAGGPCTPTAVLPFLQKLYSSWNRSLSWESATELSCRAHSTDASVLEVERHARQRQRQETHVPMGGGTLDCRVDVSAERRSSVHTCSRGFVEGEGRVSQHAAYSARARACAISSARAEAAMLAGAELHVHGRSSAAEYFDMRELPNHHVFPRGHTVYVAVANSKRGRGASQDFPLPAAQSVEVGHARVTVALCELSGRALVDTMLQYGLLHVGAASPWTSVAKLREYLVDVAVVVEGDASSVA